VSAFRDLPAALDLRVAPDCLPGPGSATSVGDELSVNGVADAPLQCSHRVLVVLAFGAFAVVVGAAGCVVGELVTAAMWIAWLI
jgi:hypothetical protein